MGLLEPPALFGGVPEVLGPNLQSYWKNTHACAHMPTYTHAHHGGMPELLACNRDLCKCEGRFLITGEFLPLIIFLAAQDG